MTLILITFTAALLTIRFQRNYGDEGVEPVTVYKYRERNDEDG